MCIRVVVVGCCCCWRGELAGVNAQAVGVPSLEKPSGTAVLPPPLQPLLLLLAAVLNGLVP